VSITALFPCKATQRAIIPKTSSPNASRKRTLKRIIAGMESKRYFWMMGCVAILALSGCGQATDALVKADKPADGTLNIETSDAGNSSTNSDKAVIGKPAPAFSLNDLNDKPIAMSDFKGKVLLIDFWASWCKNCEQAEPTIQNLATKYKAQGLVVLSINALEKDSLMPEQQASADLIAISKKAAKASSLVDVVKAVNGDKLLSSWGFSGLPAMIVVDREGNITAIENSASNASLAKIKKSIEEAVL